MKKLILLIAILLPFITYSQVGIGTTNPAASAILEVSSTTKGMLTPRLTTTQRLSISSPAQSLLVYDTDANNYYYYSNSNAAWTAINVGNVKTLTANYTLTIADSGRILDFDSPTAVTLSVPTSGLPIGFQVSITQSGNGPITIQSVGLPMIVSNRWGGKSTQGKWSKVGLEVRTLNSTVISGDLQ
jgi:hypothetical protein